MDSWSDAEPYAIFVAVLIVPAVLTFAVFTAMRLRRTDFRRGRAHKGQR
jgi:hypothetical protein